MKQFDVLEKVEFGDMTVLYFEEDGKVAFALVPADRADQIVAHRALLDDTLGCKAYAAASGFHFPAARLDSVGQCKIAGDAYAGGFSAGVSMRNSETVDRMRFGGFCREKNSVTARFSDGRGLRLEHRVRHPRNAPYLEVCATIVNEGPETVKLEYFPSFSLGMLSPFQPGDGSGCYRFHRWHSAWSAEGRLESRSLEELHMEPSWSAYGVRSLRFGEQGSMPVRGFFPMAAFEDTAAGVIWGVELEVFGSWELELSRSEDFCTLSGGLPDREFGQWTKRLQPGESFSGPVAALSCVAGNLESLLPRLSAFQEAAFVDQVPDEAQLPVIFNEWCTTWGRPVPGNLLPILEELKGHDIGYFVLDCGWFNAVGTDGLAGIGDWNVPQLNYPGGIGLFADRIREAGFRPGIWFEFEIATADARLAEVHPDWLLRLDGEILKSGPRRFLDFRKKEVIDYLDEKLIKMLRENHFGYLKVDYNAPTGFGCDGEDSPAEELRKHMVAVEMFFRRLRRELPDLVIEICSSGGHRLSAGWMRLGAMGSFSDAHEAREIPIIAANTAQLIPMRSNQIWAVLRPDDTPERLYYSLCAGMLGRLCLSGTIAELSDFQKNTMYQAVTFYREIVPVIQKGHTHVERCMGESWSHPTGYQLFRRSGEDRELFILHLFAGAPSELRIALDETMRLICRFAPEKTGVLIKDNCLIISGLTDFSAAALYMEKVR